MKKAPLLLFTGLCAGGFGAGVLAKKAAYPQASETPPASSASETPPSRTHQETTTPAPAPRGKTLPGLGFLKSTETIDTLGDVSSPGFYARFALWTVDATAGDIAAYWERYKDRYKDGSDARDMVFLAWMRLDPGAGLAAIEGSDLEYMAWWAWGSSDPDGAYAAATAKGGRWPGTVVWGIGQFNPTWVRDHCEQLPPDIRSQALSGLAQYRDSSDPEKALDFTLKYGGYNFDEKTFRSLISQDPMRAFEWALKHPSGTRENYGEQSRVLDLYLKEISSFQPELLSKLAAVAPAGETRRKIDRLIFEDLLKTDPEAAKAEALSLKSPRIASERLASIGLSLIKSNPEEGFTMMRKILEVYPDALSGTIFTMVNNGGSSSSKPPAGVTDLMNALIENDPSKLMDMQVTNNEMFSQMFGQSNLSIVAGAWARKDLDGLSEWIGHQDDPSKVQQVTSIVITQLQSSERYSDAAQWTLKIDNPQMQENWLRNLLSNWSNQGGDAPRQWLENSGLSPELQAKVMPADRSQHNR